MTFSGGRRRRGEPRQERVTGLSRYLLPFLWSCGPYAEPGPGVTPGAGLATSVPSGRLVYLHEEGEEKQVWITELSDPSGDRELAGLPGQRYPGPAAPDGSDILVVVVEEDGGGHRETPWRVPLSGAPPSRIAGPAGRFRSPSWSPDGSWLYAEWNGASLSGPPTGPDRPASAVITADIFRFPRSGGEPARLTSARFGSFEPAVGSDGRVLFASSRDGNAEIYLMNADGSHQRPLAPHPADDTRPRWRSTTEVLFLSDRSGARHVWRQTLDGGEPTPLRGEVPGHLDIDFSLSPDSRRVAVTTQTGPREVDLELWDLTSGQMLARLDAPGPDEHPAWSPDSRWLVWTSSRGGDPDLWLLNAEGGEARPLVARPGPDWLARWLP